MEETNNVVKQEEELTTPDISEDEKTQTEEIIEEEVIPSVPVGSKTNSELLLKSLHEEREKRRILEEEKKLLEEKLSSSTFSDDEVFSDEGKILKKEISALTEKINSIEEEKSFEKVCSQYPILKEKSEEFKEFCKDYPKTKLENMAKLYLSENGLFEPSRKGLEKPTGGQRVPVASGMTADDVKTLRETNFKKYQEMIMKGQIKIAS